MMYIMSESLGPTLIFDVGIGSIVKYIDVESDELLHQFRDSGLDDEAISSTVIEFKSGTKPNPSDDQEWAETTYRHVAIWLGGYVTWVLASPDADDRRLASAVVTSELSRALAHEGEHLRQFETGELPPIGPEQVRQAALPYEERPWEQKAIQVEESYRAAYDRNERGFLALVEIR
jgi:hypothetical protein